MELLHGRRKSLGTRLIIPCDSAFKSKKLMRLTPLLDTQSSSSSSGSDDNGLAPATARTLTVSSAISRFL